MINQRSCPFCKAPAANGCSHLALAAEARDFVRSCIEACQGQALWRAFCQQYRDQQRLAGHSPPEQEDFMWLETAFCDRFLKHLHWFGGLDYEWRTGPKLEQGGFWVLLWSKEPRQFWWELRDDLERRTTSSAFLAARETTPWLLWLAPR
jgi:hypothetical protein